MKRFSVDFVDLPADHPIWPNERFYKLYDRKTDTFGFAGYRTKERAEYWAEKKNAQLISH